MAPTSCLRTPMTDHAWVIPYAKRVAEFLGLNAWEWTISHRSGLSTHRGLILESPDATCFPNWPYLTAKIEIDSDCWIGRMAQPTTAGKLLICHEMLHIALAQLSHSMNEIINVYFPAEDKTPSDKTTAFTLYTNHEEHTITRLSRQVYEALERDEELARLRRKAKRLKKRRKQAA